MHNRANGSMAVITLIMGLLAASFYEVKSQPNTNLQSVVCNVHSYAPSDAYANSVAYVVSDLMNVTPSKQGYNYYVVSPYPKDIVYGHATCSGKLANSECATCMVAARGALSSYCPKRIGAQVTMVDCSMRYENYVFA